MEILDFRLEVLNGGASVRAHVGCGECPLHVGRSAHGYLTSKKGKLRQGLLILPQSPSVPFSCLQH